ncbi:MAG: flagellar hook protein, partial [Treponema sp.]|nr:flagellar hook protein [Treponema sp.]
MSDIYIPGVRSRFNSERLVEDLMTIERIPRDRVQTNIENLQTQKSYWQEVGKRISSLREAANHLFSFQNPFNERIANSSDSSVLTALATREASEQTFNFSVKQTALADRFLSQPLNERDRIDAGVYIFSVGGEEISINFRGGTLSDFANIINTRGRDKIGASLISVQSGTRSLLIESKLTGAANRLEFAGDTVSLATRIGMMEQSAQGPLINVDVSSGAVRTSGQNASDVSVNAGVIQVAPLSTAVVPVNIPIAQDSPLILRLNTQTRVQTDLYSNIPPPPPGPSVPAGSVTYGGITIENEPSSSPLPEYVVPVPPARVDDMSVLNLVFSDG